MKPTLVDNCEHYSYQTHNCNKCGRGLPDVCAEFENMRNAARAYEAQQANAKPVVADSSINGVTSDLLSGGEDTSTAKRRGRPKGKVTE